MTLHEALHALLDMGHRQRDPTSIMSYHGVVDGRVMHRMDEALLRLNSHPLVEPGMTMMAVRDLIVFSDELLDGPIHTPLSPLRMLEEAYLKLLHADSSSYKISISESRCGGGIGWAEYETANYWFEGARWTRIEDGSGSHHIIRHHSGSPGEVWSDRSGEWREVEWERSALSGFLSQRGEISLHSIIRAIVSRYDAVEVDSLRRVDGKVTITIRPVSRDAIAPYHGSIVFLLDDQSYEVLEYSFSLTTESCGKIDVRAYDGRFEIEFPLPEAIAERSRDLKSCEMEDLGYISDVIRREGVFPGSCGLDPDRNVRRYYFSLDGPDKLVGIRVHSGYGPIALRLLDADEVLETSRPKSLK